MGGTGKRGDCRGHRRVQIGLGADDHPRGERGRVGAVLGVQHHVGVHELGGVFARFLSLEHVKKIRRVAELSAGRDGIASVANVVVGGDDHRHLRSQSNPFANGGLAGVVANFRIKTRQRRHRGAQHVHGVSVFDRANDVVDGWRDLARGFELRVEGFELRSGGKLAV